MKARFSGGLAVAAVVLAAAAVAMAAPGAGPPTVADFPTAPPPFVMPAGGSQVATPNEFGGTDIKLSRPDGSLFARQATDSASRMLDLEFYFTDGTSVGWYAAYVSHARRPASGCASSHGAGSMARMRRRTDGSPR